jgi:hypothetical protein
LNKIEFFGLPCSGKTYIARNLVNEIINDNKVVYNYSSAFFNFIFYEKNISLVDYISLKYFSYFKSKNISSFSKIKKNKSIKKNKFVFKNPLSSYLYNTYMNLCKKYSDKNNTKIKKMIFQQIEKNSKDINNAKRNAKLWFIEFFAYQYIAEKYADKIDFLVDDESFYQKIFIFSNLRNNEKFLKKYIYSLDKTVLLIIVQSTKKKILIRSKKREGSKKFHYLNLKHLTNMIKYEKKVKKIIKKNKKFITFQNNHNYLKQIKNIHERIKK